MFVRSCIPQTRTRESSGESLSESNCQICSTSYTKIDEIPFDFNRRRLSVVVAHGQDRHLLICKGAVEEIFAVATQYEFDGTRDALDESHFETAKEETIALNEDGFRVVAVAYKEIENPKSTYT